MTKKRRSNGFMYFAEAMRATYEAENSANQLSTKRLMERANKDWKAMNDEQREKWIAECRRRKEEVQSGIINLQLFFFGTRQIYDVHIPFAEDKFFSSLPLLRTFRNVLLI
uniref:HMG box domain-containing protein n=1 Tax=Parascaris univalens TaxID=6257 RepID=A0A915B2M9_PARUN